jgi:hypothetical protein
VIEDFNIFNFFQGLRGWDTTMKDTGVVSQKLFQPVRDKLGLSDSCASVIVYEQA